MFREELRERACSALDALAAELDDACSGPDAVSVLEDAAAVQHRLDGITAWASKRVEDTKVFVEYGDRTAAELCARIAGIGVGEARRSIETATRLESLPETDAAMREGRLSGQEAALISAAAIHDPTLETELLAASGNGLAPLRQACVNARARNEDPEARSERQHRSRSFKMWTNIEGMVEGHFELTPEVGGALKLVIERETQRVFRAEYHGGIHEPNRAFAADALVQLVIGEPGAARPAVGHTVHVLIDHAALTRGAVLPGETCEMPGVGPVNVPWVRKILGEAFVTAVIRKGRDITTVAHFGRHIPAELRTALIVGGNECCVEGCTRREYLEIDHSEVGFAKGGPTAWWNLELLCSIDHRRKTEGWVLGPPDPVTGKRRLDPPGARHAA